MKEVLELTQEDIIQILQLHFGETRKWERVRVILTVHAAEQDGPRSSPGYATARVEKA